ncbi:MAG: hypothetical protein ACQKBY_02235 [Verrucomicrobiales bacterium]
METPPSSPKQRFIFWFCLSLVISGAIVFIPPFFLTCRGCGSSITEATNNARQIGTFLTLYAQDHGQLPWKDLPDSPYLPDHFTPQNRSDSNYLLGHLLRAGYIDSEEIFFAKASKQIRRPDGNISSDATLLAPGECGFTYLSFQDRPFTLKDNDQLPVLVTPLLPGSHLADPEPFNKKAVILRLDSSVHQKRIEKNGEIIVNKEGHSLFQIGPGTSWGEQEPRLHHPLYRD